MSFGDVVNHLWQSSLFALGAGLLTLVLRAKRADVRYWVWWSASCKFLLPFALLMSLGSQWRPPHSLASSPAPSISRTAVQLAEPFPPGPAAELRVAGSDRAWTSLVAWAVWVCGAAFIAGLRLRGWVRIRTAVRAGARIQIPLVAGVEIRSVAGTLEPGVVGWFTPILLLPTGLADLLTQPQFEAVVAHELCHIRRRDNLTASIQMIVETLFWFYPPVWWIGARLIEERERACDEDVLRRGAEPQVYAEGIVNVCKTYVATPLRCVSGVTGADLRKRIDAILDSRIGDELRWQQKAGLALAAVGALSVPLLIGVLDTRLLRGQPAETLTFEVASVKRSAPILPGQRVYFGPPRGGPGTSDPGQITWTYVRLKSLLTTAYDANGFQINGPAWLDTERYDVMVKVPAGATTDQVRAMWRNLLAERFGVKVHHESKEFKVQELVIGKGGSKLKEAFEDPDAPIPEGPPKVVNGELREPGMLTTVTMSDGGPRAHSTARAQRISKLTEILTSQLETPVLDKTGMTGKYDFALDFAPNMHRVELGEPGHALNLAPTPETDLESAIQLQLGLRLVAAKQRLDVVVVDQVQKVPTGN